MHEELEIDHIGFEVVTQMTELRMSMHSDNQCILSKVFAYCVAQEIFDWNAEFGASTLKSSEVHVRSVFYL